MKSQKQYQTIKPILSAQAKQRPSDTCMTMSEYQLITDIQTVLTPDLLQTAYLKRWTTSKSRFEGHCYHASEALYHMLGGKKAGYIPQHVWIGIESHWFLRVNENVILDPTAEQFTDGVEYDVHVNTIAIGTGYLTAQPSIRAQEVIRRVKKMRATLNRYRTIK